MAWLFNTVDVTWHLWVGMPAILQNSWCGLPYNPGSMSPTGGSNNPTKCQTCLYNVINNITGSLA